jgi:hypothetical protein
MQIGKHPPFKEQKKMTSCLYSEYHANVDIIIQQEK